MASFSASPHMNCSYSGVSPRALRTNSGMHMIGNRPVKYHWNSTSQAMLSIGVQSRGFASRIEYSIGGTSPRLSMTWFTPSVNRSSTILVCPSRSCHWARALRCRPIIRAVRSSSRYDGPSNSLNSPRPRRRKKSIWKRRSCAMATPNPKNISEAESAKIDGMPKESRATVTGVLIEPLIAESAVGTRR